MNWINLRIEQLRSPELAMASHEALATWIRVLAYCCAQENGGRLVGAAKWTDRAWMVACGVGFSEVSGSTPLLAIEGDDVLVSMYPLDKQQEVQADRLNGQKGGTCKTQAKTQASQRNGTQGGRPKKPKPNPSQTQAKTQRNRKGIGIGKEGNISAASLKEMCEEIYSVYPRREAKPKAMEAISKALTKVSFDDLRDRTRRYAKARDGQPKQFTPLPATWFNQERYNDDPANWEGDRPEDNAPKLEDWTERLGPDLTEERFAAFRAEMESEA